MLCMCARNHSIQQTHVELHTACAMQVPECGPIHAWQDEAHEGEPATAADGMQTLLITNRIILSSLTTSSWVGFGNYLLAWA
jgi:hypothetical protein